MKFPHFLGAWIPMYFHDGAEKFSISFMKGHKLDIEFDFIYILICSMLVNFGRHSDHCVWDFLINRTFICQWAHKYFILNLWCPLLICLADCVMTETQRKNATCAGTCNKNKLLQHINMAHITISMIHTSKLKNMDIYNIPKWSPSYWNS